MKRYLFGLITTGLVFAFGIPGFAAVPTITPGTPPAVCAGVYSTLSYSSTNSPNTYSITWSGSPVGLPNVAPGTVLPLTSIPIIVLTTCLTGSYTGNIVVTNSDGSSAPMPFTLIVHGLPSIASVTGGGGFCFGGAGVHVGMSTTDGGVMYQLYRSAGAVGTAVWGTGAAIDFGLETLSGLYTVIATNASTGCTRAMLGGATVTVHTLPTIVNVTGGGGYCAGGAGVTVGLSSSVFGTNYQLKRGGLDVGGSVPGIGMAIDFGAQTIAGVYTVVAVDTLSPFCPANMSGSASVLTYPVPNVYNVTGGGDFCVGGYGVHIGLSASTTGVIYKLYRGIVLEGTQPGTGVPLDFGLQTHMGVFTVKAINSVYGCRADMADSAAVGYIPNVLPTVTISGNIGMKICKGQVDTFTAMPTNGGTAPTYLWNLNGAYAGVGPTYSFVPSNNDNLQVILTSNALCASPYIVNNTAVINVLDNLIPTVVVNANPGTTITNGQSVTLTAIPVNKGVSPIFQWYVNGVLVAGANTNTFTSSAFVNLDSITCKVYGCADSPGRGSIIMHVMPRTGVNGVTSLDNGIQVTPNPSNGLFTIHGDLSTAAIGLDGKVAIKITDVVGKVIYSAEAGVKNGKINETIHLSNNVSNGMYLLNLRTQTENIVSRIIIE